MSSEDLKPPQSDIPVSISRYLANSVPGFFLILYLLWLHYTGHSFFGIPLDIKFSIGGEAKIFLGVILFIVALPLGLIVDLIGYYLLGWLEYRIAAMLEFSKFVIFRWLVYSNKESSNHQIIETNFNLKRWDNKKLDKEEFIRLVFRIHDIYRVYKPDLAEEGFQFLRGVMVLLRSCALLMVILAVNVCYAGFGWYWFFIFLSLSFGFMLLCALEFHYFSMRILRFACLICSEHQEKITIASDRNDKIVELLIQEFKTKQTLK